MAAGSSAANIWAFTGSGAWVRYNGRFWTHGALPLDQGDVGVITAPVVLSSHDVWALGYYNPVSPLPYIAHYNGHGWTITHLFLNTAIVSASALRPGDIWAVGQEVSSVPPFTPELWHYTSGVWRHSHIPGADAADFIDQFAAVPGTHSIWAAGKFAAAGHDIAAILLDGRVPR